MTNSTLPFVMDVANFCMLSDITAEERLSDGTMQWCVCIWNFPKLNYWCAVGTKNPTLTTSLPEPYLECNFRLPKTFYEYWIKKFGRIEFCSSPGPKQSNFSTNSFMTILFSLFYLPHAFNSLMMIIVLNKLRSNSHAQSESAILVSFNKFTSYAKWWSFFRSFFFSFIT